MLLLEVMSNQTYLFPWRAVGITQWSPGLKDLSHWKGRSKSYLVAGILSRLDTCNWMQFSDKSIYIAPRAMFRPQHHQKFKTKIWLVLGYSLLA